MSDANACALPTPAGHHPAPRTWPAAGAQERFEILRRAKTIAIVGASDNPARASYFVATYLRGSSPYDVYYVNPRATEILGQPAYASLADLPVAPDIVDVFRKHDDLPGVAQEAVDAGASTLWLQLGSWHEEPRRSPPTRDCRSSWTAASRSSTRASTAGCTSPGSTPGC